MLFTVIVLSIAVAVLIGFAICQAKSHTSQLTKLKAQHQQFNLQKNADFERHCVKIERRCEQQLADAEQNFKQQMKECLADAEQSFNQRMNDMREQNERMNVLAEQKGYERGKNNILENLEIRGFSVDEEVDFWHFWQKKLRRTLGVVLLEGKPIHVWGDMHKVNLFNIPEELKKVLSLVISSGASVVTGVPVHIGTICRSALEVASGVS